MNTSRVKAQDTCQGNKVHDTEYVQYALCILLAVTISYLLLKLINDNSNKLYNSRCRLT